MRKMNIGRTLYLALAVAASSAYGADNDRAARRAREQAELDALKAEVKSSLDGVTQKLYLYVPDAAQTRPVPLLVALHTWSGDITQAHHYTGPLREAKRRGWAMVGADFRGPNWTPQGCGSDAAVQDIVDAVAYAKAHAHIDAARVYIAGASGGGHMALLMAGRHPELFAGVAAFCPPADLALWHRQLTTRESLKRQRHYAGHMVKACGGTPDEKPEEYAHRSSVTHLAGARRAGLPVYIETGIHDGWTGSVPCGQAVRAFNRLADEKDRIAEADIAFMEERQQIPEHLRFAGENPFYQPAHALLLRRTSAQAVLHIFNGGHAGNWPSAYDFLARQRRGAPADFTVPDRAQGRVEALYK